MFRLIELQNISTKISPSSYPIFSHMITETFISSSVLLKEYSSAQYRMHSRFLHLIFYSIGQDENDISTSVRSQEGKILKSHFIKLTNEMIKIVLNVFLIKCLIFIIVVNDQRTFRGNVKFRGSCCLFNIFLIFNWPIWMILHYFSRRDVLFLHIKIRYYWRYWC